MALQYPVDCDTPRKRIQFLLRFQYVLRIVHNGFGKWLNSGVSLTKYNDMVHALAHFLQKTEYPGQTVENLETQIKAKYPYVAQISETVWRQFLTEDFYPRHFLINSKIPGLRGQLRELLEWSEQIDEISWQQKI